MLHARVTTQLFVQAYTDARAHQQGTWVERGNSDTTHSPKPTHKTFPRSMFSICYEKIGLNERNLHN